MPGSAIGRCEKALLLDSFRRRFDETEGACKQLVEVGRSATRQEAGLARLQARRAYLRQHANVIRYAGQHIQHMEKALEQMNLKLTETISDITGVTGQAIIKAIVRGARDPRKLAKYRDARIKTSEEQIAQAF
jgi:hypothetical protein